jgi:hypothetical protein
MSDTINNTALQMDGSIADAYITPNLKFDFIYNYMTNVDWKYLSQIPSYKQPAYQLKRLWLMVSNGFVPEWHCTFIPTKLGNTIVSGINRKIFGGALLYESEKYKENPEVAAKLKWWNDTYIIDTEYNFEREIERMSWFSMASGASAIVAKKKRNGSVYFEAYREDKYLPTFSGRRLISIRLFSTIFDTIDSTKNIASPYVLEEYRFFNAENRACSVLRVYQQSSGDLNSIVNTRPSGLKYSDMPDEVRCAVKEKIGNRLNKVVELPFMGGKSLGCAILNNSSYSAYYDIAGFSDAILAPVIEQIFEYERSYTTMTNDIALGRGQVLVPDTQDLGLTIPASLTGDAAMARLAAHISMLNQLNTKQIKLIPNVNPEEQKAQSIQFEMRIAEHVQSLNAQRANIINGIGINPSAIDPTLSEVQKTATQVVSDEQNLITFVSSKRKEIKKIIDWAIDIVMNYYFGVENSCIYSKFSNSNLSNALLRSQMIVAEYQANVRSVESAVEKLNEDDAQGSIDRELQRVKAAQPNMPSEFIDSEFGIDNNGTAQDKPMSSTFSAKTPINDSVPKKEEEADEEEAKAKTNTSAVYQMFGTTWANLTDEQKKRYRQARKNK